jgi:Malectin domain
LASGLDIIQAAGGANIAFVLEKILSISDGNVTIKLVRSIENPIISGIEIISLNAPTPKPVTVPIAPTAPPIKRVAQPVTRINVGGINYKDSMGNEWQQDEYYDGKGFPDRRCPIAISNTTDDILYCTNRWFATWGDKSPFQYEIPVPSNVTLYDIRLHFAELFFTRKNQRVFGVRVENTTVVEKLDVVKESGGKNIALVVSAKNVMVRDGYASVELVTGIENPFIAAIEVIQQGTISVPVAVLPAPSKAPALFPMASPILTGTPSQGSPSSNVSSKIAITRINAGGDQVVDLDGNTWLSDSYFGSKGRVYKPPSCSNTSIANTANDVLYCEHRWFSPSDSAPKGYEIPIPKSNSTSQPWCDVRLHFAEIVSEVPGCDNMKSRRAQY